MLFSSFLYHFCITEKDQTMGRDIPEEIIICMGSSCFSRGNKKTLGLIKQYLKEKELKDNLVFRGSHCFGECENGPVIIIGSDKHTRVSSDHVTDLLDRYFNNPVE